MLLNTILANEFMCPRLKVQIYNGVKNNIPSFLKLYNEYYYLAVGNSIEFFTDIQQIRQYLPLIVDKYEFNVNDAGEFIIYYDGKCVGRNFFGDTIKIIEHYGLEHIITMLKSPLILESITLYNKHDTCLNDKVSINGHRRPKIRRRLAVSNV
jgi:hypothetical protein